jgi:hypothetical protein
LVIHTLLVSATAQTPVDQVLIEARCTTGEAKSQPEQTKCEYYRLFRHVFEPNQR